MATTQNPPSASIATPPNIAPANPSLEEKSDASTVAMFMNRTLREFVRNTGPRKHPAVFQQSLDALNLLETKYNTVSGRKEEGAPLKAFDADIEILFLPFQSACESKFSKFVQLSLDCIQKLISYGCLRASLKHSKDPSQSIMDLTISTICSCYDQYDESIQLQMIKALLSTTTSNFAEVHDANLLKVLRSCRIICLNSKNAIIEKTSKTAMTQIIHIVFSRLENISKQHHNQRIETTDAHIESAEETNKSNPGDNTATEKEPTKPLAASETRPDTPRASAERTTEDEIRDIIEEIIDDISTKKSEGGDSTVELNPKTETHDVVDEKNAIHTSTQPLDADGEIMENLGEIELKDAFLIFRSLCKQSVQKAPENATMDSFDIRKKILALEMIQIILVDSGPLLRQNDVFISAIKQYLCMSLLNNGVSPLPFVFGLSMSIFLTLIANFKDHLKSEIGVFFTHIFLSILESHHSTIQQKLMIVSAIYELSQDPQTLVDIFINYDCDADGTDIFGRMVNDMAKVSRGSAGTGTLIQEHEIRIKALKCLATVIKSMVDWCKDFDNGGLEANEASDQDTESTDGNDQTKHENRETNEAEKPTVIFEKKMLAKKSLENGMRQFNSSPNKGIKSLIDAKILGELPEDIANFLHVTEGLSKTMIGEYIGDGNHFNITVMYAYVDQIEFQGISFDEAIRLFLRGFRLPGEAQKIDRLMEKFAEKYCKDNPSSFKHADTAYVLAYSIIMLNTDAHNPMVKHKMTKAEFVRNSSNIHEDETLAQQYLEEIYDRIVSNEIKMKDEASMDDNSSNFLTQKTRTELYLAECEKMVSKSQMLFKQQPSSKTKYHSATQMSYVKPMFEVAWCPMLSVFSVMLEQVEDTSVVDMCLSGFKNCIRISSIFYLETERKAFVSGLSKFTSLISTSDIKMKNIQSIYAMIAIASTCGNYLQGSWGEVLRCISELERLRLLGSGVKPETIISNEYAQTQALGKKPQSLKVEQAVQLKRWTSTVMPNMTTEEFNSINIIEHMQNIEADIDNIFTQSTKLTNEAIVFFVQKLCETSTEDIDSPTPRIFCLRKIVEIASFNMSRIRYVWSNIWAVMASHFRQVGCHRNYHIAMYAVDSLRQLAMKFLEKEELVNYHFQKEFLKPFEHIMTHNQSLEIRELVVRCLQQMVDARAKNIKSGWKSIFTVYSIAAADNDESVNTLSFQIMDNIIQQKFAFISETLETFVDCIHCLVSFGCNVVYPIISLKAMELIRSSARAYLQSSILRNQQSSEPSAFVFTDSEHHLQIWFPILTGLSRIINQQDIKVQKPALVILVDLLLSYGSLFSPKLWELIFRGVLFPIFDDIRHVHKRDGLQWMETTCIDALTGLTDLLSVHFQSISFMFADILDLYCVCITQVDSEKLTRAAVTCLHKLLMHTMQFFTEPLWENVLSTAKSLFKVTTPTELMTFQSGDESPDESSSIAGTKKTAANESSGYSSKPGSRRSSMSSYSNMWNPPEKLESLPKEASPATGRINFHTVRSKCVTQLTLIQMITEFVTGALNDLDVAYISSLCSNLYESYEFAAAFNRNIPLRVALWKAKFMSQLPNLIKQETNALTNWLKIYFFILKDKSHRDSSRVEHAQELLTRRCRLILDDFIQKESRAGNGQNEESRETQIWVSIITFILQELYDLDASDFKKSLPVFYSTFGDLMLSTHLEVRQSIRSIYLRIGKLHSILPEDKTLTDAAAQNNLGHE